MSAALDRVLLKKRLPFRLGTTSYIFPDDIIPNVTMLAPAVDDIELILFESDEISNYPDHETIRTLKNLAAENDLTYTVHLPLDIQLGSPDDAERISSVNKCLRAVTRTEALKPFAYIVHLNRIESGIDLDAGMDSWLTGLRRSMEAFHSAGLPMERLCIETLDYPFERVEAIINDYETAVCLDVGHILLYGYPLAAYLGRYFEHCPVIHLHGIRCGKDHRDIAMINSDELSLLFERLSLNDKQRVLTLEMFSQTDLKNSLTTIEKYVL